MIYTRGVLLAGSLALSFAVASPKQHQAMPDLKPYFVERITTDTVIPYATYYRQSHKSYKSHTLQARAIAETAAKVWTTWCEAVNDSANLAPLTPIADVRPAAWQLPEALEPHAVMHYYYFSKADSTTWSSDSAAQHMVTSATAAQLPLFLYLHGSGPRIIEWATGMQFATQFADAPSAYFIPRIPNEGAYYRWWQRAKQFAWEKLFREAVVSGAIDADRIYLLGVSEGAYGSQRLASFYADYLAAAGPMAGGEPLKNAPAENCANIGFSLLTGEKDSGFYRDQLTRATQTAFDSLAQAHPGLYPHRVELIPDRGHFLDYTVMTPWLSQFVRNPYPRYFCWEDFPMDGRRRVGFYNLMPTRRPDNELRTRYEVSISDDNIIIITIQNLNYTSVQTDPQWGIELASAKTFSPASGGALTLFLNDELIDPGKSVTVVVNGVERYRGKAQASLEAMATSCALFGDPRRVFPYAIALEY